MPRLEKWLSTIAPGRPASDVAGELLAQRLKAVRSQLDDLFAKGDEVEAVHQLRVWTRRAEAALGLFDPLLPNKRRRRLKKMLRRLRSSAGAVRDCDIQLKHLSGQKKLNRPLIKALARVHRRARRDLKAVVKNATRRHDLKKRSSRLLKAIDASRKIPFSDFSRAAINPLAQKFFTAANADLSDDAELHALRIAAKRWRYALELASSALQTPWSRELYENLSEIQDRLGAIHDRSELCTRIAERLEATHAHRHRKKLRRLLDQQQEELAAERAELTHWWTSTRRQQLATLWQQAAGLRNTA